MLSQKRQVLPTPGGAELLERGGVDAGGLRLVSRVIPIPSFPREHHGGQQVFGHMCSLCEGIWLDLELSCRPRRSKSMHVMVPRWHVRPGRYSCADFLDPGWFIR